MQKIRTITVLLALGFIEQNIYAQDNNKRSHQFQFYFEDVSILGIRSSSTTSIVLSPEIEGEAGAGLKDNVTDSSLWLNYTNIRKGLFDPAKNIYVKIQSGTVPTGFDLHVKASAGVGVLSLFMGIPVGSIKLSTIDQKLIMGIYTTYTGLGTGKGHQLIYTLTTKSSMMQQIDFDQSNTLSILYTIAN